MRLGANGIVVSNHGGRQLDGALSSTRALPAASVSTPLAWDELSEQIRADHFRIDNLRQRLDVLKVDPWAELFRVKQRLP